MRPVEEQVEDYLPEFEELTPELLEDECIRGDVMLRAAVILLSCLLGCVLVTNSEVLVQIRTGQYISSHGFLPPRIDVLGGRDTQSWLNLAWLSDLVIAGIHSVLGHVGLSLLTSLTVALSFVLVTRIRRSTVTSWWQSIVLLVGLIAVFPIFQPGASTITILGLAAVLYWMSPVMTSEKRALPWAIVPIMLLLGNGDQYVGLSLCMLIVFLGVEHFKKHTTDPEFQQQQKYGWIAVGVGSLLNPWPLSCYLSLFNLRSAQVELSKYGQIHEWFPHLDQGILSPAYWQSLNLFSLAVISLLLCAVFTTFLNRKQISKSWTAVWVTANLIGALTGEGTLYVALVNAVVASINGQQWYLVTFKNSYEITSWNVLSSRVGRAVTVLGIFLVAYLSLNGALMGPESRRIGIGLDPRLQNRISSLERLFPTEESVKVIPTTPQQGDLLLWAGQKPLVDSRMSVLLAASESPSSAVSNHLLIRRAIFVTDEQPVAGVDAPLKQAVNEGYRDVFVRLWSPRPAYNALQQAMKNSSFTLTALDSAGARFEYLADFDAEHQADFISQHGINFTKLAFDDESNVPTDIQATWPLPASSYDRWLVQKIDIEPPQAEYSRHLMFLLGDVERPLSLQTATAIAMRAVQAARAAIQLFPNHPAGYRQLTDALHTQQQIEAQNAAENHLSIAGDYSRNQILTSAYSAALAGHEDPLDLARLIQVLVEYRAADSALTVMRRLDRVAANDRSLQENPNLEAARKSFTTTLEAVQKQIDASTDQQLEPAELASIALAGNCPELALTLLEKDKPKILTNLDYQLFYTTLLLQNGRIEDAYSEVQGLKTKFKSAQNGQVPPALLSQYNAIARNVYLAAQDFASFRELTDETEGQPWEISVQTRIALPFGSYQAPTQQLLWPVINYQMAMRSDLELMNQWAIFQWAAARTEIEARDFAAAKLRIQKIQKWNPEFANSSLVKVYASPLGIELSSVASEFETLPAWIVDFEATSQPIQKAKPEETSVEQPVETMNESEETLKEEVEKPSEVQSAPVSDQAEEAAQIPSE